MRAASEARLLTDVVAVPMFLSEWPGVVLVVLDFLSQVFPMQVLAVRGSVMWGCWWGFLELSVLPEGSSILPSSGVDTHLLPLTCALQDINSNIEPTRRQKKTHDFSDLILVLLWAAPLMGYKAVYGQTC